jgi:GGDEF domain-containing protein
MTAGFIEPGKAKDLDLGIYTRDSGVAFLDTFLRGVADSKRAPFTLSYLVLNRDKVNQEDRDDCVKDFVDVVINGIRGTDIFAQMASGEFFILFPNCSSDVVSNILTTIESKLELISQMESSAYEFDVKYAILEINESNLDSVETILERVKALV